MFWFTFYYSIGNRSFRIVELLLCFACFTINLFHYRQTDRRTNPCKFGSSLVCKSNPWTCIACSIKSVKNKRQLVLLSEMWQSFCNKIRRNKLDKWLFAAISQQPSTLHRRRIIMWRRTLLTLTCVFGDHFATINNVHGRGQQTNHSARARSTEKSLKLTPSVVQQLGEESY